MLRNLSSDGFSRKDEGQLEQYKSPFDMGPRGYVGPQVLSTVGCQLPICKSSKEHFSTDGAILGM